MVTRRMLIQHRRTSIGDGTEATILYAVGGQKAYALNDRRKTYESNIDRSERNAYKKNLNRLGLQQYQYGQGTNVDGHDVSGTVTETGQISTGAQRGYNRSEISGNGRDVSNYSYTPTERDREYLDAVNNGDMETANRNIIRRINYDALSKGSVSDGLSARFRRKYAGRGQGDRRSQIRQDIQADNGTSGHNKAGISEGSGSDGGAGDLTSYSYTPTERDTEYLDAVNRGDTETAQRMVDDAAKEAGYNSPKIYHGTGAYTEPMIMETP